VRALVLADTHLGAASLDRMPSDVWSLADAVDVILHAGDVVEPAVLDALAERAAVEAVLGNNDSPLVGVLPEVLQVDLEGVTVAMVHDAGPKAGRAGRLARRFPGARVVVFGHSHEPVVEQVPEGPLLLNPGSPTHRRRQPVHTVGLLEVAAGEVVTARIVEVGPLADRARRGIAAPEAG
jgi:putative phosphoesterase